jgi:hypothetical protein
MVALPQADPARMMYRRFGGTAMISKLTTLETALLVAAVALVFAFVVGAV